MAKHIRHLEDKRFRVALANRMKTKTIASTNINAKLDAEILVYLLRADLVAESYVPPSDVREKCALVRHRLSLVKIPTMVKNKVHAMTDKYGLYCQKLTII